uniref:Ribonuclease kappa-like n=1 Tax=Hirondellea gigas TaxID=1518452 RepID=A0A2P2ICS5_9CRUS
MPICGYMTSVCGVLLSLWGIIQLLLMGVLFYIESPAFIDDLPIGEHYDTEEDYLLDVHRGFRANAFNCLIGACLYIVTLVFSTWQFYVNQKTTFQV